MATFMTTTNAHHHHQRMGGNEENGMLETRVLVQTQDRGAVTGTLKFYGNTRFKSGTWVGVELDEAEGKHDGMVDGVRYFTCKPKHGIFVRPSVVSQQQQASSTPSASSVKKDDGHQPMDLSDIETERKSPEVGIIPSDSFWFDIKARAFIFNKSNSQWDELLNGVTLFSFCPESFKVKLNLTCDQSGESFIDHLVDVNTKLEKTIVAQQSWVFRACRRIEPSVKDVLCLQFSTTSLANDFLANFEHYRSTVIDKDNDHNSSSKGKKNRIEDPNRTRVMRRRLTVSGSDPRLDGYKNGVMPDIDITGKTLSEGQVGQWGHSSQHKGIRIAAYSGVSKKGMASYNPKKANQDAMIMTELPFNGYCNGELLLCVFDGHGENGHLVSSYFRTRLAKILASSPKFAHDESTGAVIADALLTIENEIIQERTVDTSLSGTTAVVSVLRGNKLFVANVGDSRIVKGTVHGSEVKAIDLSQDHKPDLEAEHKRILSMGGRVFAMKYDDGIDGPARVWLSYADMPGLAMSRSLCDTVGKEAGVTSDAELFTHELTPNHDKFIILATDGLWEFMSSQEVCDIVKKHTDPRQAIAELVEESNRRWRMEEPVIDDTTITIAYLQ